MKDRRSSARCCPESGVRRKAQTEGSPSEWTQTWRRGGNGVREGGGSAERPEVEVPLKWVS